MRLLHVFQSFWTALEKSTPSCQPDPCDSSFTGLHQPPHCSSYPSYTSIITLHLMHLLISALGGFWSQIILSLLPSPSLSPFPSPVSTCMQELLFPLVPYTLAAQRLWLQIISLKPDSHSAGYKLLTSSIYECQFFGVGKEENCSVKWYPSTLSHL